MEPSSQATPTRRRRWPFVVGGILLFVIAAVAIALNRLDAYLLERARTEAATYSTRLGRPITLDGLSTQLFPRLGAVVKGATIGPAAGEDAPLLTLERADVAVELGPLWRTRGKEIHVENAELTGLTVTVLRQKDGTTNVEQLLKRLDETAPKEAPAPEQPEAPRDLSGVRVDRAALVDGKIRFVDRSAGTAARELAISDLDVEAKDLRVGKALVVDLTAAVFAEKKNFTFKLQTAPLDAAFNVLPERLTLKAERIDLAPLGPYLPPDVGLQAGTLDADWTVELGGAVPGGSGPTKLAGGLKAMGLRFAGAQGGKALDVVLDTDVKGDATKGDLTLDKLELKAGPARLSGKGRVLALRSDAPRVEGLVVEGEGLDPAAIAAYYPPLAKSLGGRISGPVGLSLRGSGGEASQQLDLSLDLTPVRLHIPGQLDKAAGAPMKVSSTISGAAAGGGKLRFQAQADLTGVDLRPGGDLNKAPGQRLEVKASGSYQPEGPKQPLRVDISSLQLDALDDSLKGTASFEQGGQGKAQTTAFAFDLQGAKLDADRLLLTEEQAAAFATKPVPAPASGSKAEAPASPDRFRGYRGDMKLTLGQLRYKQRDLSQVVARIKMVDDLITLEKLTAGIYGGQVTADGTSLRLGPVKKPYTGKVTMKDVDLEKAMTDLTDHKVMGGRFSGDVALDGAGFEKADLAKTLAGVIQGNIRDGSFYGVDLIAAASSPVAKALPFASKALNSEQATSLGDLLPFGVRIENGAALLKNPIKVTKDGTGLSLEGGAKLDGTLDLTGTVALAPALIQKVTQGKVIPTEPIPVPMKITGPAWKPNVSAVDVKPAVESIVRQAATGAAGKLLGDKGNQLLQGVLGGKKPADQQQAQPGQEPQPQKPQEDLKKRAADEAKKRLEGLFRR